LNLLAKISLIASHHHWFMLKPHKQPNKAFTLIELLVVISIISLLSTVIFAVFSTSRVQAQDSAKKETVHSVQQALELYHSTYNKYPDNYTCTDTNTCIVGRASPAVQGDTTNGGDWAYKKSMQELVTAKVMPSIPETSDGPGYAYFNAGDNATFYAGLTGGYGGISAGQTFPQTIQEQVWYQDETFGPGSDPSYLYSSASYPNSTCIANGYTCTNFPVVTASYPEYGVTQYSIYAYPQNNCTLADGQTATPCPNTSPSFCSIKYEDPSHVPPPPWPPLAYCYWVQ